jgi:DNA recombination protein RmuC
MVAATILLAAALVMLWRLRRRAEIGVERAVERLVLTERAYAAEALQRHSADLAERIARASGDLRQGIADRLTAEFREVQSDIDRCLALGRREQLEGLAHATQVLERKFQGLQDATQRQLEGIRSRVDDRLAAIGKDVQTKLDQNLREGFQHFEKVQQHLRSAEMQLQSVGQVGQSINELNALLKLPHLRGGFGEATLEQLLSDFLPAHLYELQATIGEAGRVDALVRFPRAALPIDSKFPREQVLPLFENATPEKIAQARKALSQVLRAEAARIGRYVRPENGTMDMALMFLPSETLYCETIRDVSLWQYMAGRKVFPVSPNTLAITLRGIAIAHDYYEMARNVAQTIEEVRKAQRHFDLFQQRFDDVGRGLDRAREAYHTASTHLSRFAGSVVRLGTDSGGSGRETEPETQDNEQNPHERNKR